jgi:hypothetical protein
MNGERILQDETHYKNKKTMRVGGSAQLGV